jgi:hypothetical protein
MFRKKAKPMSESEARKLFSEAVRSAIKTALDNRVPRTAIANSLNSFSAETMQVVFEMQVRRQAA